MKHMRIDLVRTGGFAGVRRQLSVDTSQLPPDQAERVVELADRSHLDALAAQTSTAGVPDEFQYDLTVTREDRQYHIRLSESAVPAELRSLIDLLFRLTRRR
jgi:hypothetical protein